jgi:hypothetical protein
MAKVSSIGTRENSQPAHAQVLGNTDSTTDGRMKLAQARAFLANLTVILP